MLPVNTCIIITFSTDFSILLVLYLRPVAALIDISVLKVDPSLKDKTQEMVVQEEGPTDGTVIVANSDQTDISDESTDIIVDLFGGIGEIILVR